MANIISIGTAQPAFGYQQQEILSFMVDSYGLGSVDARKLSFLYRQSDIRRRFSVLPDFLPGAPALLFSKDADVASLEQRMRVYDNSACPLAANSILEALNPIGLAPSDITHLITVSCTGMSAPGLDLQLLDHFGLNPNVFRTSVNFMGCYGAIHGLKLANLLADANPDAVVAVVATELCTLHFQQEYDADNAASSMLFADGSAALIMSNRRDLTPKASIASFYSAVANRGRDDMSWNLSSKGFLMKLSSYVPRLIEEDIETLVQDALQSCGWHTSDIQHWCIHPGGKKILDHIGARLGIAEDRLTPSRSVLADYGNMSSPTVLYVLKRLLEAAPEPNSRMIGMAFGPGLTMETFMATTC